MLLNLLFTKIFLLIAHCHFAGRYFEGGISSVYLWDLDHGFAGVVLIKKAGDGSQMIKGCWDSIHVIEVQVLTFLGGIAESDSTSCLRYRGII